MAIIAQKQLFSWKKIESRSDLDRLRLVLEHIPDEPLMVDLEKKRGRGRDDNPVRVIWNTILAGVVFGHETVESLRRELMRNGELRMVCGCDLAQGADAVPSSSAYTRFLKNIIREEKKVREIFDALVDMLKDLLKDFGEQQGIDAKAIASYANRKPKNKKKDGRRDSDANKGKKEYSGTREDGSDYKKVTEWFGYKVHLLVDTRYELPIHYEISKASKNDSVYMLPMLSRTKKRHPELLERCQELSADRGYDSKENNQEIHTRYGIKPIIAIRHMWKDGDKTRALYDDVNENVLYDEDGQVSCVCPDTGEIRNMVYWGYEKDRGTVKYRCPAKAYGVSCAGIHECPRAQGRYGKIARVKIEDGQRIFVPLPRTSYAWKRKYKNRTAVERINSRLDVSFGFVHHTIRGQKKLETRMGIALVVMLAMAVGHIKEGRNEQMRSLVARLKAA